MGNTSVYPATVEAAIQLADKYKKHNPRGDSNKKPVGENIGVSFAQTGKKKKSEKLPEEIHFFCCCSLYHVSMDCDKATITPCEEWFKETGVCLLNREGKKKLKSELARREQEKRKNEEE